MNAKLMATSNKEIICCKVCSIQGLVDTWTISGNISILSVLIVEKLNIYMGKTVLVESTVVSIPGH